MDLKFSLFWIPNRQVGGVVGCDGVRPQRQIGESGGQAGCHNFHPRRPREKTSLCSTDTADFCFRKDHRQQLSRL